MDFLTFILGVIGGISLLMFIDWYNHRHDKDKKK